MFWGCPDQSFFTFANLCLFVCTIASVIIFRREYQVIKCQSATNNAKQ